MGGNAPAVGMDEPRPRIRRQGGAAWGNVSPYAMGGANWGIMDDGLDGGRPADGWGPVRWWGPPTNACRQPMFALCRWAERPGCRDG